MFIFFPIRTDRPRRRIPWVNYSLVAVNVAIFLFFHFDPAYRGLKDQLILHPENLGMWYGIPYQFITYQFLHEGWMHIIGNMIFLYVFGNSVEDRLGKIGYLAFYLAGGVLAGIGNTLIAGVPVLGASGSICAVTGAYLALFPLSNVTIFYWFFIFIDYFEISSIFLILFQVGENIFMSITGGGFVAYWAHLAGYSFGFLVGMGLLWSRLLPREPYDLLSMIEHRRRRAQFRTMTRKGYQPWHGQLPADSRVAGAGNGGQASPLTPQQARVVELRRSISSRLAQHDLSGAASGYTQLLEADPDQVMSQQEQLDLANQLTSDGHYAAAARAYELFLKSYGSYPQVEQIQLMLGLVYARYLHQSGRARPLLTQALPFLKDAGQQALARQLLEEIKSAS